MGFTLVFFGAAGAFLAMAGSMALRGESWLLVVGAVALGGICFWVAGRGKRLF